MIKHVNYQIRNIPFLVSETENVVPDAPLTNYPGEDFYADFDPTMIEIRCKDIANLGYVKESLIGLTLSLTDFFHSYIFAY